MRIFSITTATSALAIQAGLAAGTIAGVSGGALLASAVPALAFFTPGSTGSVQFSNALNASTASVSGAVVSVSLSATHSGLSGATITLTAPSGLNFAFAPTVNCSIGGAATALTTSGFTSGSSTAVYTSSVSNCTSGAILSVQSIFFGGANTYAANTSNTTAWISFSSNVPSEASLSNVSGTTVATFVAPVSLAAQTSSGGVQIDITLGATKFVSGTTGTTSLTIGTVTFGAAQAANDTGGTGTAVSMAAASGTLTISAASGNFNGLSTVYASTVTSGCATAAPTGSASAAPATGATSVALTGLTTTASTTYTVCGIASGTTVLQPATFRAAVGGTLTNSATINTVTSTASSAAATTYNGQSTTLSYYVGAGSYNAYLNVYNANATSAVVYLVGTPSGGTQSVGTLDTALAGSSTKLYTPAQVATAFGGTNPFNNGNGGRLQVLVSGGSSNSVAQNLLVNPGGVVTQIQQ
jgi:hypothetical protein